MLADGFKNRRTVCDILGKWSNLIERGTIRNQTITGHSSVCRLDTCHTAKCGWLTDTSTCIGTKCIWNLLCCNGCCRTTGRTSRYLVCIPRISCHTIIRSLGCTSHGELIHVCLSDDHRACLLQFLNGSCCIRRNEITQNLGRTACKHTIDTHVILDGNRNTSQRSGKLSTVNLCLNCFRLCQCACLIHGDETVVCLVECFDSLQTRLRCLYDGHFFVFYFLAKFNGG